MEELPKAKKQPGVRRTRKQIIKLLKEYHKTEGMSVVDFCQMHKIKKARFYNWQKRFNSALPGDDKPGGFIPLQPIASSVSEPQLFAEVNGIRLYQVVAPDYLKALIR